MKLHLVTKCHIDTLDESVPTNQTDTNRGNRVPADPYLLATEHRHTALPRQAEEQRLAALSLLIIVAKRETEPPTSFL